MQPFSGPFEFMIPSFDVILRGCVDPVDLVPFATLHGVLVPAQIRHVAHNLCSSSLTHVEREPAGTLLAALTVCY